MKTQVQHTNKDYITIDQLNKKRSYRRMVENTIQGSVHHFLIEKFGAQLCEGSLIEICNFNVQDCNKNYKVSDHKFQMILTERTTITSVDQNFCKISLENFRFRNHEDLAKLKDMTQHLYDVIGYIKKIKKSDVRTHDTPTLRRVTLTLLLEGGMEITATIWAEQAEQAEQLEDKYRVVGSDNIVLIMTSVLIKTYQGAICLSASSGTKFYLSREFDPVTTFRKSFSYDGGCLVNLGSMIEQAPMNISFKIEVIVDDGDDSATLVIFDQDGSQITGTTAEDIKRNSGEEELKGIPKSLRTIIGETYLFALSRVTTTAGLQILKVGTKHYDSSVLQNIVYQEVFNNIER
ncbi:unnamed protein product [Arabidopsis halleri]